MRRKSSYDIMRAGLANRKQEIIGDAIKDYIEDFTALLKSHFPEEAKSATVAEE